MSETMSQLPLLQLTAQIIAAHTSHNHVTPEVLLQLIGGVHATLAGLGTGTPTPVKPQPAVPVKRSVFPDHIVCLEDGKKLKMLKRHLKTTYDLTPRQYREKWGLPSDYPMVAPNYAARRSTLAKKIGLGRKPVPVPEPVAPSATRARRGRPPKQATVA
jgi:predicted transcriptional regulator